MKQEERDKLKYEMGKRLYSARKAIGMSQDEAAFLVGKTQQNISRIEQGEILVDTFDLYELCLAYGISVDYVFTGKLQERDIARLDRRAQKLNGEQFVYFQNIANNFFDALGVEREE